MADKPLEDWEFPDEDEEDGDEVDTIACPACHRRVYEEAEQCPYCGHYIESDEHAGKQPWFIRVAVVLLLITILAGLLTLQW